MSMETANETSSNPSDDRKKTAPKGRETAPVHLEKKETADALRRLSERMEEEAERRAKLDKLKEEKPQIIQEALMAALGSLEELTYACKLAAEELCQKMENAHECFPETIGSLMHHSAGAAATKAKVEKALEVVDL